MSRADAAMTCQDARELFSAALDGALNADARQRLEAHLAGCADCRRERERFERTVGLLRGAAPIRAPAGFVDRVLTALRPEPWWQRFARGLVTPWAVKLPLEAAAVALLAITAVYLYRETPEQRYVVQQRQESPAPEPARPEAARASREKSDTREPLSAAKSRERSAPSEETSPPASPRPVSPPPTAAPSPPPTATPVPPRPAPPQRVADQADRAVALKHDEAQREELQAASRPLAKTRDEAPIGVEGRLSGVAPAGARAHVADLVTRLGGAIVAERSERGSAVIDILIPRARYDELARGLAQLGRWTAPDLAGDADPVRILVRLE